MIYDQLTEQMATVIRSLLEKGFEPPYYFVSVSDNGGMMFAKMSPNEVDTLDAEFLSEFIPENGNFTLPINMMFVDRSGKAAHVMFEKSTLLNFSPN